jgi:hypothetical protein
MPVISWSISLDEQPYSINLNHGMFSGKRVIQVNGTTVHKSNKFFDVGTSEHPFQIDNHHCKITIHTVGAGITYNLYIDEKQQKKQKFTYIDIVRTMPLWGWLLEAVVIFTFFIVTGAVVQLPGSDLVFRSILTISTFLFFFYAIWITSSHKVLSFPIRFVCSVLLTFVYIVIALLEGCLCGIPQ